MKQHTKRHDTAQSARRPKAIRLMLTILSGLLLSAAWPTWGFAPMVFLGLIPMLWLEDRIAQGGEGKLFWLSFLGFLVWNLITTWWVWNATPAATAAWILNALFMTTVFNVFHLTKIKVMNNPWGNVFLIP